MINSIINQSNDLLTIKESTELFIKNIYLELNTFSYTSLDYTCNIIDRYIYIIKRNGCQLAGMARDTHHVVNTLKQH